ncbi:MAG: hypothetical protein ACRD2W_07965 [Acidimicrobiales bacterium]
MTVAPVPVPGELYERWFEVAGVRIGLLAEIETAGAEIHFKDIAVYPHGAAAASVGAAALLHALRMDLVPDLRAAGYSRLRVTGERLLGPRRRRTVDFTVDLSEAT